MFKFLTIVSLGLLSIPGFASDCTLSINFDGKMHYMSEEQKNRVTKLLTDKGYILESEGAEYHLNVERFIGWMCGTGLSDDELENHVPARFEFNFILPWGTERSYGRSYEGTQDYVDRTSINELIGALDKEVPVCINPSAEKTLQAYNQGEVTPGNVEDDCLMIAEEKAYLSTCIKDSKGRWEEEGGGDNLKGTPCIINQLRNEESVAAADHPVTGTLTALGLPVINRVGYLLPDEI